MDSAQLDRIESIDDSKLFLLNLDVSQIEVPGTLVRELILGLSARIQIRECRGPRIESSDEVVGQMKTLADFLTTTATLNVCRHCGCDDHNCEICIERTGEPCHWLEPGLCSACAMTVTESIRALNILKSRYPEVGVELVEDSKFRMMKLHLGKFTVVCGTLVDAEAEIKCFQESGNE